MRETKSLREPVATDGIIHNSKYDGLPVVAEILPSKNVNRSSIRGVVAVGVAVACIIPAFLFYSGFSAKNVNLSLQNPLSVRGFTDSPLESSHDDINAVVTNEYSTDNKEVFAYPFLDGALFMEPHRDNTVTMKGLAADSSDAYTWILTGLKANAGLSIAGEISGNRFTVVPSSVGQYNLEIIRGNIPHWTQYVVVKYVRRELTTLNDYDREEFLNAFHTLWVVDTDEGKKLYGDRYKSLYYFASIHNDAGGNPVCDEFHRNIGFLHNHVFLGAFLEQSLQLVNPRTALHYWEYTQTFSNNSHFLNGHMKNQLDGGQWTELMTDRYFGQSDPYTGEILTGRWAHTSVPRVNDGFYAKHGINPTKYFFPDDNSTWKLYADPHISSSYGLLRSPWNFSPANYTIRFNNVNRIKNVENMTDTTFRPYLGSTCDFYKALIQDYTVNKSLASYLEYADAQAHGYVHYTIAGTGGDQAAYIDQQLRSDFGFSNDDITALSWASSTFYKNYLSGANFDLLMSENPFNCTQYPWDSSTQTLDSKLAKEGVSCTLNEYFLQDENTTDTLWTAFLGDSYIHVRDMVLYNFTFEDKKHVMRLIFSRLQQDGDMATSASAVDPFFWVAHGAVERLYQRVIFEDVLLDLDYIPVNSSYTTDVTCQGHATNGTAYYLKGLEFMSMEKEGEKIEPYLMTNSELSAMLNPTADDYAKYIHFIYDNSGFEWCGSKEEIAEWFVLNADDDQP